MPLLRTETKYRAAPTASNSLLLWDTGTAAQWRKTPETGSFTDRRLFYFRYVFPPCLLFSFIHAHLPRDCESAKHNREDSIPWNAFNWVFGNACLFERLAILRILPVHETYSSVLFFSRQVQSALQDVWCSVFRKGSASKQAWAACFQERKQLRDECVPGKKSEAWILSVYRIAVLPCIVIANPSACLRTLR